MLHLLLTHSGPISGTGKDDLEHISTVGAYIHYGAGAAMSDPRAVDLSRAAVASESQRERARGREWEAMVRGTRRIAQKGNDEPSGIWSQA